MSFNFKSFIDVKDSANGIEAHFTVVFAALAVSRYLQQRSGVTIKKLLVVSVSVGPRSLDAKTAEPPVTGRIDLGPMPAVERTATIEQREDAEDWAAVREWQRREAAGESVYVPIDEARRRLGLGRRR